MNRSPLRLGLLLIPLVLVCFALSPTAQAQLPSPVPDGGYPNGNTAEGDFSLAGLTTGSANTALGFAALDDNSTGSQNTATGFGALFFNDTGGFNTANGFDALYMNTDGEGNTASGGFALATSTGDFNTAVGVEAGFNVTSGSGNTFIGQSAGEAVTTASNVICVGSNVVGDNTADNRTFIGNIGTFTQGFSAGTNELVTVNLATGLLGHFAPTAPTVSSRRYKEDIKPLDKTSEALFSLKPVSYRLKKEFDPTRALAFGLIAEEVEKVNPDLVSRNNKGQVESVRYEMVNAMMLNEFLKEHRAFLKEQRKVEAQEATITQLKKEVGTVVARLKEQALQIQKVSDKVEMSKPAPQTVVSNQ
jgi:hypothetical protein